MSGNMVDALLARIASQRELLAAMDVHYPTTTARVTARDGSVSAEVDGLGALVGLWLTERAYQRGAAELGALIVETAHSAEAVVRARQAELLHQLTQRMNGLCDRPLGDSLSGSGHI